MLARSALLLGVLLALPAPARAGSAADAPSPPPTSIGRGKIGALIGLSGAGTALVTQVLPGTPAARAGLQPLDQIVKVDGVALGQLALPEMIARITGAPGTRVKLVVERGGQQQDLVLTRETLGGVLNDVVRDPRLTRLARFLVRAQGGAARLAAIRALHLETRLDGVSTHYLDVSSDGYRSLTCAATGLVTVFGRDGKTAWGLPPPGLSVEEHARPLMERPARALPNLACAELEDPDREVRYKGRVRLSPPPGLPFRLPRLVHRFELGGESFDFDVASGLLARQVDASGYPHFFGDYRRVGGVAVPGRRTVGRSLARLERVSFSPIPAARFRPRGALHCDP
jgi:hypothetical protein